jgi:preprotein translocase subunit SecE
VARNRKRAKDRRARRPQPVVGGAPAEEAPSPIGQATPDVELAEAQLALGRPELDETDEDEEAWEEAAEDQEALQDESFEPQGQNGSGDGSPPGGAPPTDLVRGPAGAPTPARVSLLTRLMEFLRGSWLELQRVQWPDRRQVFQATGVVIGFVIVAGVFLGLADLLATHLVNYILNGQW